METKKWLLSDWPNEEANLAILVKSSILEKSPKSKNPLLFNKKTASTMKASLSVKDNTKRLLITGANLQTKEIPLNTMFQSQ